MREPRSGRINGWIFLAVAVLLTATGCRKKIDLQTLETLARMSDPVYRGEPVPRQIIGEINKALAEYRQAVDEGVRRQEELGLLYRDLALRYLDVGTLKARIAAARLRDAEAETPEDRLYYEALALGYLNAEIYREALIYLEKAVAIFPGNPLLYYNAGICAANIGKAMVRAEMAEQRSAWLTDAAAYYRRALELDRNYDEALYGLSILFVYELDRPSEAEPLLRRLLELQPRNTDGRFLLGAVYYLTARYDAALREYELIEESGAGEVLKEQARVNTQRILDEIYELREAE